MRHLALVAGVVVFAPDHIQSMSKSSDVDELEVNGKKQGAHKQPNQNEWNGEPTNLNAPENHRSDDLCYRPHHAINGVVHSGCGSLKRKNK